MKIQKFNFHNCRGLFKCWEDHIKLFSLMWKSCSGRKSPVEVLQACFIAVQVLMFSSHNCRGGVIPVDASLRARNIRESRIYCRCCPVQLIQACLTAMKVQKLNFPNYRGLFKCWDDQIKPFFLPWKSCGGRKSPVEIVQDCFSAVHVLKFSFLHCRGHVIHVDVCWSAGKIWESCFTYMQVLWSSYKGCWLVMKVHKFNLYNYTGHACNTRGQLSKCWEAQINQFTLLCMSCGGCTGPFQCHESPKVQFSWL